jgi:putative transposase
MRLRYRYRLAPTAEQRQALARVFGCARVVCNDGLRLREDADRAGLPSPSDAELSRRLTLAKQTPERAWLGAVSAVALHVLPSGRLRLPKIGDVRVGWSRPLPSAPSSVTVTLDRAGRYHASFVVEAAEATLPASSQAVGVDVGLTSFAVQSTGEKVDNPRWLRQREQALRRSQRNVSRKQQGSKNREKCPGCGWPGST